MADFKWSTSNFASVATYNILASNAMDKQIPQYGLSFDAAGAVKMGKLPYYPKYGAPVWFASDRADFTGRRFYKAIIESYTRHKEDPSDSVEDILRGIIEVFGSPDATIADLAQTTDKFFRFQGE